MDFKSLITNMYQPIMDFMSKITKTVLSVTLISLVLIIAYFFIRYQINPFTKDLEKLASKKIKFKPFNFARWFLYDIRSTDNSNVFKPYGFTLFVGRQGKGKTISMVNYLNVMREKYPKCKIVTNFTYAHTDFIMTDWRDFFEIRNGTDGVIFAIDEIHSEYSSASWKDFPESLLSEISQQRKQRIKIIASSQVFTRVVKQLREQCFSVIVCNTYFKRWTFNKEYDYDDYATVTDNPAIVKKKLKAMWKTSFVHSNDLRNCYDTFEKIERLEKTEFIPRNERGNER